mmetsp:Transcript_15322/g.18589  ORF Transcript_15322/g.18589 Transcript_15322/m.18589 type:complete len:216 (+) Transcript_15322:199-846(+)
MAVQMLYQQDDEFLNSFMDFGFNEPVIDEFDNEVFPIFMEPVLEQPEFGSFEFEDLIQGRSSPKKLINRKRKSEDWDAKPLEKRASFDLPEFDRTDSMESELEKSSDHFVNMLVTGAGFEKQTAPKQKRTRWTATEVRSLWGGIERHGNNWRAINKSFLHDRTYYQVKDKGRRLLASEGWISGRSKVDTDEASEDAKVIGRRVNKRYNKMDRRRK